MEDQQKDLITPSGWVQNTAVGFSETLVLPTVHVPHFFRSDLHIHHCENHISQNNFENEINIHTLSGVFDFRKLISLV